MHANRTGGTARRNQILEAAFALEHANQGWSLAEVAKRIGVSKTAIYRHFRNRAEIETAMEDELRSGLAAMIEATDGSPKGIRLEAVSFFRENPGYHSLIMGNLFTKHSYEVELVEWLKTASPRFAGLMARVREPDENKRLRISVSILKNCVLILGAAIHFDDLERIQWLILDVLENGIPGSEIPPDARYAECERISRIEPGEIEPNNRLFDAISAVIGEHGVAKTTIERIAEKMGTAKSSLYFYCRNKEEMLGELVRNETKTLLSLCAPRVREGKTFAERLYILMAVQANYLARKPDMFRVFSWIRYETMRGEDRKPTHDEPSEDFLALFAPDGGPFVDSDARVKAIAAIKLAAVLSTSVVLQSSRQGDTPEKTMRTIRAMHTSIISGDKE
jgi:AcrR family transcriptional regulator